MAQRRVQEAEAKLKSLHQKKLELVEASAQAIKDLELERKQLYLATQLLKNETEGAAATASNVTPVAAEADAEAEGKEQVEGEAPAAISGAQGELDRGAATTGEGTNETEKERKRKRKKKKERKRARAEAEAAEAEAAAAVAAAAEEAAATALVAAADAADRKKKKDRKKRAEDKPTASNQVDAADERRATKKQRRKEGKEKDSNSSHRPSLVPELTARQQRTPTETRHQQPAATGAGGSRVGMALVLQSQRRCVKPCESVGGAQAMQAYGPFTGATGRRKTRLMAVHPGRLGLLATSAADGCIRFHRFTQFAMPARRGKRPAEDAVNSPASRPLSHETFDVLQPGHLQGSASAESPSQAEDMCWSVATHPPPT